MLSPIVTEDDNLKKNSVCSITYVSDIGDEINTGKLLISMRNILPPSNIPVGIFHSKQHSEMVNDYSKDFRGNDHEQKMKHF